MKYTIQYILCLCFLILACVIPFHEGMKKYYRKIP